LARQRDPAMSLALTEKPHRSDEKDGINFVLALLMLVQIVEKTSETLDAARKFETFSEFNYH
jgi:hypothetical protein